GWFRCRWWFSLFISFRFGADFDFPLPQFAFVIVEDFSRTVDRALAGVYSAGLSVCGRPGYLDYPNRDCNRVCCGVQQLLSAQAVGVDDDVPVAHDVDGEDGFHLFLALSMASAMAYAFSDTISQSRYCPSNVCIAFAA